MSACDQANTTKTTMATSLTTPPEDVTTPMLVESRVDYVVIQKKDHILSLWKKGRLIKTYPVLAMGANPIGQKVYEGDERTPEGTYYIEEKHPSQNFQKFLKISYPNDKDKALAKRFGMSPGGSVGIHGDRGGMSGFFQRFKKDWTDGCLAMRNADIEEIYSMVDVGTPILLKP
jgi:murein L,D-transpeptidase YafK